jgi:2-oxoglutarate ferredoxin oxidoreductase subunit alpha
VASSAVNLAREEGIKVGLFRPITLAPFPKKEVEKLSRQVKRILVVEMNTGMMLEDINNIVQGRVPVEFYGRLGGVTPFPDEILDEIRRVAHNKSVDSEFSREEWLDRLENIIQGGR